MAWLVAPYRPLRRGRWAGRSLAHLPHQQPGQGEPWVEWEVLNPWRCLVWTPDDATADEIAKLSDAEPLPNLPLNRTLGELTAQQRSRLAQLVQFLGYDNPLQALKTYTERRDLALTDVKLGEVLRLLAHRRRKGRLDENGDYKGDGIERGPAKLLPGLMAGGAAPTQAVEETFNRANGTGLRGKTSTGGNVTWGANGAYSGNDPECQNNEGVSSSGTSNMEAPDLDSPQEWWVEIGSNNDLLTVRYLLNDSADGYGVDADYNGGFPYYQAYRLDGYSQTQLGSNLSGANDANGGMNEGYKLGATEDGAGGHEFYEDTGSGWTSIGNRTDSTYTPATGNILFVFGSSSSYEEISVGPFSTDASITLDNAGRLVLDSNTASVESSTSVTLTNAGRMVLGAGSATATASTIVSLASTALITLGAGTVTAAASAAEAARRYGGMLLRFVR